MGLNRREFLKNMGKAAAVVPVIQFLPKEPVEGKRSGKPPRPRAPHPTAEFYTEGDIAAWIPMGNTVWMDMGNTLEVTYEGNVLNVGPGVQGQFSEVAIDKNMMPVAVRGQPGDDAVRAFGEAE